MPRRRFLLASGGLALALADLSRPAGGRTAAAHAANEPSETLRVLLRRAGGALVAQTARVSCDGPFTVRDAADTHGAVAATGARLTIERAAGGLWWELEDGKRRGPFGGPLEIRPEGSARLSDHRGEPHPPTAYRGIFQIARSTDEQRLVVLNVLDLDEYLKGVVPVEMPTSFGPESARVQAVAARGYALARRVQSTHAALQADLCDSSDCQSYGGLAVEQALSSAAVETTRGRTLLRDGALFAPFYSSTCGGHTEDPSGISGLVGAPAERAARQSVPDGELPANVELRTEQGAATFYGKGWDSHCSASLSYRWKVRWDREPLETLVDVGLRRLSGSPLVSPSFAADASIGHLKNLAVAERSASGRVLALQIEGANGVWTVRGGWAIRALPRGSELNAAPLPSSAFVLQLDSSNGKLTTVSAFGAGSGHGVGMCQWGARGLAAKGLNWEAILAHYYPTANLGPIPHWSV
ncbi:MAG: SpoIID/LytB domain-containing protein [Chloroflexi bacterium]|nr:SpoIID/LytB domain-containing protein [Chloroflexota bacterium]